MSKRAKFYAGIFTSVSILLFVYGYLYNYIQVGDVMVIAMITGYLYHKIGWLFISKKD